MSSAACASRRRRPPTLGLECHAGHGLDYETARAIAAMPEIVELNIGHFLIGEAIFVGLAQSVRRCARRWTRGADSAAERARAAAMTHGWPAAPPVDAGRRGRRASG